MADNIYRSKHAFGSEANVDSAIQRGLIDAYDILFLDEKKIGWIDVNGNKVIIDHQVKAVDVLPQPGVEATIYICGDSLHFWNGEKYVEVGIQQTAPEQPDISGITETEVDNKILAAKTELTGYVDSTKADLIAYVDEKVAEFEPGDGSGGSGETVVQQVMIKDGNNQLPFDVFAQNVAMLNTIPVVNGQMIFIKDTKQIAVDMDGVRAVYGGVIELGSEYERLTLSNPIVGATYYVPSTKGLWLYRQLGWEALTHDVNTFLYIDVEMPEAGQENILYVDKLKREISVWDENLRAFVTVANMGIVEGGEEGAGNDVVLEQILMAKQEAINSAAQDATEKANAAQTAAISHADEIVAPVSDKVNEHTATLATLTTDIEDVQEIAEDLSKRVTSLELGGGSSTAFKIITNEEIDALFA